MARKKKWWEVAVDSSLLYSERQTERARRKANIERDKRIKAVLAGRR